MQGIIPLGELEKIDIKGIRDAVQKKLIEKMIYAKIVTRPDDVKVRDLVFGDSSDATDFVDLDGPTTAAVTGQEHWLIDASAFTAGDLSSILASGTKCPDNKMIGIFGFFDLSPIPELTAIRFKRGSDVLDFWEVEQCYVYQDLPGGMTWEPVIYEQNDPMDIQMNVTGGSTDLRIGLYAYIAERYGEQVTSP